MSDTIRDREEQIVEEFGLFDTWDEKYEYIIDLGKKLAPLADEHKKDENKIRGCQSTVWMVSQLKEGKVQYYADSDAIIVKGLVSMLIRVLSNQTPKAIVDTPLTFIDGIGMTKHLAQTRSNGLLSMVKQMKLDAMAYLAQQAAAN